MCEKSSNFVANFEIMLFNSFEFLLFLPIVFLFYWFVFGSYAPKWLKRLGASPWLSNLRLQNFFIVVVSYIFYGWWDWRFLLLIALTSFCSWLSGVLIAAPSNSHMEGESNHVGTNNHDTPPPTCFAENKEPRIKNQESGFSTNSRRKVILWSNIILNLTILGFFKYFNFFVHSFVDAFAGLGIMLHATTLNIILPVGISFYTFQALSYSIDVYKGKIEATRDIVAFFAFVSFFPQLVAGPIERATNLLPQFQKPRTFDYDKAVDGCRQMLWGFFKKIVIADNCAVYVNQVFENYQDQSGSTLLLAAIFFTFQIYGDFSGYSDIAIGCARLFGINLMRNFNFPYFSRDIAEFWRRWHISLTTWFRDYIYIPLGGSRTTKAKVIRNTFIIFLVSGFWHGANWTFIAWGAYHALLFLPLILLGKNRKYTHVVASTPLNQEPESKTQDVKLHLFPSFKEVGQMLLTFFLAVIGWIIFRAETITQAWEYMAGIVDESLFTIPYLIRRTYYIPTCCCLILMLIVEWGQRNKQHGLEFLYSHKWLIRYSIYIIILSLILLYYGKNETFIYFQF